jgi:hypothetical protein
MGQDPCRPWEPKAFDALVCAPTIESRAAVGVRVGSRRNPTASEKPPSLIKAGRLRGCPSPGRSKLGRLMDKLLKQHAQFQVLPMSNIGTDADDRLWEQHTTSFEGLG